MEVIPLWVQVPPLAPFFMSIKYKIVETTGCTAYDITVNDRSISDMTEQELDEVVDYLLQQAKVHYKEQAILFNNIVELFQYSDYESDGRSCEQCGDTVSSTTWNI